MKKNKLLIAAILLLVSITTVYGQQDPQYTQYMYNMNVLNPAYAGSRGVTSIALLGRSQWVGVDGAPQTATLSVNSPLGKRAGFGFSVIHDEIGPAKENNVYIDFSYAIPTSEHGKLAFGVKGGATFLNVREVITVDPDPLNTPIDLFAPNFGLGVMYYNQKFYIGLSAPNILETKYLEKENGISSTASEKTHYFFTSGYVFDIDNNLKLKPSTMVKASTGTPVSIDLSLNLLVQKRVEFGLSVRLDDSLNGIVGFQVNNNLKIGYAYEHTTSRFKVFNSGSHEIIFLFDINKRKIKSPRFF
ncbi:PorP/SprF family type IX secretion system membrane protein [Jejuia spongiicola]|uniref:Type IX secretion system membrane protein PorP/SprF n=1 Tax=Jejuia spongiicola TaxID=2942207 RepID=A0ABT0QIA3_9FLAO|nr:type IX secretion system membrane protein PorP/SprF [Jejuia spongiicola]MCL6296715.1 type IX secretion system membrane protein PorP/SprF [Jejuia spongiicola]